MTFAEMLYGVGIRAGLWLLPRTPFLSDKLRRGFEGRREALARMERWARAERREAPLIWFHAPSVGEGLQIRPVIEAIRRLRSDLQIFYTFFSPSAEDLAAQLPVDYADYLPFDVTSGVEDAIYVVRPAAIVFGKLDVWPNLTRVARRRGIALALVNGTVAPTSSRLRWPARAFLSAAYARLGAAGAISEEDAERLARLGVAREKIRVTGDAGFDQVWTRARRVDLSAPPVSLLAARDGLTLVAGSTWPEGERRLIPALAGLRARHPDLQAVLAPHEPTPDRLRRLEKQLAARRLPAVRLSQLEDGRAARNEVVVVDRVGVLADLYAIATVAYVGGGFGRRGLHSVKEPAALGVPVLFGPRHANAREAGKLIERGAARAVRDAAELERALHRWLDDEGARQAAGAAASGYVQKSLGAGRRNAELVLALLEN